MILADLRILGASPFTCLLLIRQIFSIWLLTVMNAPSLIFLTSSSLKGDEAVWMNSISQSFGNAGDRAGVCGGLANTKSQALTCSGRTYTLDMECTHTLVAPHGPEVDKIQLGELGCRSRLVGGDI